MQCKESRNKISNMIWDNVPFPEDLKSHINGCESCSVYYLHYQQGINGILSQKRKHPDEQLWQKVIQKAGKRNNEGRIIKLAMSVTSAAAVAISGIIAANLISVNSGISEQEKYRQEISANSNDLSGVSDALVEYFNYEKAITDENR